MSILCQCYQHQDNKSLGQLCLALFMLCVISCQCLCYVHTPSSIHHKKWQNMPAWPCPWGAQFWTTCEKTIPHSHVADSRTCSHEDSNVCDLSSTRPVVIRTILARSSPDKCTHTHTIWAAAIQLKGNGALWVNIWLSGQRCCVGIMVWLSGLWCCLGFRVWVSGLWCYLGLTSWLSGL